MPCNDGMVLGSQPDYETRRRLDHVTSLLCSVLGAWEANGLDINFTPGLAKWWEQHKEVDRQRIAREQAEAERQRKAQEALSKLTEEERRILGLGGRV